MPVVPRIGHGAAVRKFAVTIKNLRFSRFDCYLIEAETPQLAEEILARRDVHRQGDEILWGSAGSWRYRDAWRNGYVTVLRDRKLPEGVE